MDCHGWKKEHEGRLWTWVTRWRKERPGLVGSCFREVRQREASKTTSILLEWQALNKWLQQGDSQWTQVALLRGPLESKGSWGSKTLHLGWTPRECGGCGSYRCYCRGEVMDRSHSRQEAFTLAHSLRVCFITRSCDTAALATLCP